MNTLNEQLRKRLDLPKMRPTGGLATDDSKPKMEQFATPLYKMLVSAQLDGVSIESSSLLQRQYDEEFGVVDPASDIHTDVHLFSDALIRQAHANKVATAKSKETNE